MGLGYHNPQEYNSPFGKEPQHAAATATEERGIFTAPCKCRAKAFRFTPDAAATGDPTNSTTLNVKNKGASGAGTTIVATLVLTTGVNLLAFDETNIPLVGAALSAGGVDLAVGDVLTLEYVKVGTGLNVGPLAGVVDWDVS